MSIFKKVVKGKVKKPLCLLVYGVEGVGKSSLLKEEKDTIYIGCEENDELDVDRLPIIRTKEDIIEQAKGLLNEEHGYKTLVIDGFDMFESIFAKSILARPKNVGKTLETAEGGYGKAWKEVANEYRKFLDDYLIKLRDEKGMNIILTCHSEKTKHEDPMTMTSYDTYMPSFHKNVSPMIKEWVSGILFINQKRVADEDEKVIDFGGKRVIYTDERASHVAKNRWDLPYEIEYKKTGTWDNIKKAISKHYGEAPTAKKQAPKKEDPLKLLADQCREAANKKFQDPNMLEPTLRFIEENKTDLTKLKNLAKKLGL